MTLATPPTSSPAGADAASDRLRHAYIETIGCQMNVYDSERMLESLSRAGYRRTDRPDDADLIVINSCSVRERAEHKMISMIGGYRTLKEHNPELVLAVSGCVASQEGEKLLRRAPSLDLVLGPDQVTQIGELVGRVRDGRAEGARVRPVEVDFVDRHTYTFATPEAPQDGRVTSFITVMKGCNKFCSFCIVPMTRGREVSKPSADIVTEVEALVRAGVREVTLLGQNVNSYGKDRMARDDSGELDFAGLIAAVAGVDGLERIRFTTSHPMDCSDRLIASFAEQPKLMPYFHLPIQSGSERVLRMMRRRTVVAEYEARIASLRSLRPDLAMSTDIIVGFPGETEDDFAETMGLIERVGFASIFSFAYSPRPGTAAARIDDDVPKAVKKRRLTELQALQAEITARWMAGFEGQEVEVLFEGPSTAHAAGEESAARMARIGMLPQLMGRTPQNTKVNVETDDYFALRDWPGRLGRVRIDHVGRNSLTGTLLHLLP